MLNIPVILGTAREGRRSEQAARFVFDRVRERGFVTELIDVRDCRIVATDNSKTQPAAKKFSENMNAADAVIIVAPEYNHGYPGELKMLLDMVYEELARKPVAVCGVSIGGLGGGRMVEQLRSVLIEFHAVPIREAVYFSSVRSLFDESGAITDPSYAPRVDKLLDELEWFADALKKARDAES